jgi:predicted acylesterase/phospholipase RssA
MDFDCFIGVGGSSIVAAACACKFDSNKAKLLFASLYLSTSGYGWNEANMKKVMEEGLPLGNLESLKSILKLAFGEIKLKDVPLAIVAYNMTNRRIEMIRGSDMSVVDAIIISVSMPGYYFPTYYQGSQYIDSTPVNRFPIDIVPIEEEVYSIYIRSVSYTTIEEIISASTKPWQDIVADMVIDPN